MPADASSYDTSLPSDFVLPPGVGEFRWSDDPVSVASLGQVKQLAFELGLDQPAFSKLLSVYAGHQVAEERRFAEAKAAEVTKLGANAPGRIDAVGTWLQAMCGSELAGALRMTMHTAKAVEGFERLMRAFSSQGVSGSPGAGRDGQSSQPSRISDADYPKLTYAEKQAYASKFDQSRVNGG